AATLTCSGSQGGAIERYAVDQPHTTRGQAKRLQAGQGPGCLTQMESPAAIGTEVDQGIQRMRPTFGYQGLRRLVIRFSVAIAEHILMHQPTNHGLVRVWLGWQRHVVLDIDDEQPLRVLRNRSEEHTSEVQSRENLVCRLLL